MIRLDQLQGEQLQGVEYMRNTKPKPKRIIATKNPLLAHLKHTCRPQKNSNRTEAKTAEKWEKKQGAPDEKTNPNRQKPHQLGVASSTTPEC